MGGSSSWYNDDGRPFVLDGDKATCGSCKGLWPVYGSVHDCFDDGRSMVKDLDPVHCPCGKNRVFASGDSPFFWSEGTSSEPAQPATSIQAYDERFTLRDAKGSPLADTYYTIASQGILIHGITDSQGRTARHNTKDAQRVRVDLGHRESV